MKSTQAIEQRLLKLEQLIIDPKKRKINANIERRIARWGGLPDDLQRDLDRLTIKIQDWQKYERHEKPYSILEDPWIQYVTERFAMFLYSGSNGTGHC